MSECQSVCVCVFVCTRAGNTNLSVCVRKGGRGGEERESAFSEYEARERR